MPEYSNDPVVSKDDGTAVWGESKTWVGVFGKSESTTGGAGVHGEGVGSGVAGVSATWVGVYGESNGSENGPAAVWGEGKDGAFGVKGHARAVNAAGVAGFHLADSGEGGHGVFGHSKRGAGVVGRSDTTAGVIGECSSPDGWAGFFKGRVYIEQHLSTPDVIIAGADCAEDFELAESACGEAGTVMVIREGSVLEESTRAYDKRVAGVVSGAGEYRPGIILGRGTDSERGVPIALAGRVYCKVDAAEQDVEVGDLLTTSAVPGHAMRANGMERAFGSVLGKALAPLRTTRGLLPVLVTLQ